MSPRQTGLLSDLLPQVSLDLSTEAPDLATMFASPVSKIALEIGFGGAEHLIWQAERNPGIGYIGCEPFIDGIVKVLTAIEEKKLTNIAIHDDDARDVLRWLPEDSIDSVFILFPDPWPKVRHRKRRLVNAQTLAMVSRVMRPGGRSKLRVGTDIGDYARTMMMAFQKTPELRWLATGPADWRQRPADWPQTRYEMKAHREGRKPYFFTFERR